MASAQPTEQERATAAPRRHWDVLTVREHGEKRYWTKVGVAFKNESGSLSINLNALPLDGRLLILPPKPKEAGAGRGRA